MEPLDFVRVLKQRWKIIVAALVIAAGAAWATTPATPQFGPPVLSYTASATLLQEPDAALPLPFVALLATKGRIPTVAAEKLGYTDDPALLAASVSVIPDTEVGTLTITSSDSDGDQAAKVANAFADATISVLDEDATKKRNADAAELQASITDTKAAIADLERKLKDKPDDIFLKAELAAREQRLTIDYSQLVTVVGQVGQGSSLTLLQEATPLPVVSGGGFAAPSSRQGRLLLGLAVGLALGLLLALLMERLDTKLRRREDLEEVYRLPVVAEIPRVRRRDRKRLAVATLQDPIGHIAEAYRSLRTSLTLLPSRAVTMNTWSAEPDSPNRPEQPGAPKVIIITSARAAEGKSTTSANLAATLAETGNRVLVIDADFRNPTMHQLLDVPSGPGLADLLALQSESQLAALTRPTGHPRIRLLTAGDTRGYRGALPARIAAALEAGRAYADTVIIDAAPVLGTNDAMDFLPYVDSVVLVARLGKVTREQASRTADLLGRTQAPVLGVVAIGGRVTLSGYAYGRYGPSDSSRSRRRNHTAKVRKADSS